MKKTILSIFSFLAATALHAELGVDFSRPVGDLNPALHGAHLIPPIKDHDAKDEEAVKALNLFSVRNHDHALLDTNQRVYDLPLVYPLADGDPTADANYVFGPTDESVDIVTKNVGTDLFYRLGVSTEESGDEHFNAEIPTNFLNTAAAMSHIVARYKSQGTYWEIWNNPASTAYWWKEGYSDAQRKTAFVDLFTTALAKIKTDHPGVKVGGPSIMLPDTDGWIDAIVAGCKTAGLKPDFISYQAVSTDVASIVASVATMRAKLDAAGWTDVELILTEWRHIPGPDGIYRNLDAVNMQTACFGTDGVMATSSALKNLSVMAGLQYAGGLSRAYFKMSILRSPWSWSNWSSNNSRKFNKSYYALKMFGSVASKYTRLVSVSGDAGHTLLAAVNDDASKGCILLVDQSGTSGSPAVSLGEASLSNLSAIRLDAANDCTAATGVSVSGSNLVFSGSSGSCAYLVEFSVEDPNANHWQSAAAISKSSWVLGGEPGVVTPPVSRFGTPVATLDGQSWDGTIPDSLGSHTIVWTVPAGTHNGNPYAAISTSISFLISEFTPPTGTTFYERLANDLRKMADKSLCPGATGGDYIFKVSDTEYIHVFKTTGNSIFTPKQDLDNVQVLVVGGGGSSGFSGGGGGGAGGLVYRDDMSLASGTGYMVTVGSGGGATTLQSGTEASATYCTGHSGQGSVFGELTAAGGGYGGAGRTVSQNGASGGSGGGAAGSGTRGTGTTDQGFAGGTGGTGAEVIHTSGGGGGGAGAAGANAGERGTSYAFAGNGGEGRDIGSLILGYAQYFAGGGGGGTAGSAEDRRSAGGLGGGGAGAVDDGDATTHVDAKAGEDGLGGGGGGGAIWWNKSCLSRYNGAKGGAGVVIVRYSTETGHRHVWSDWTVAVAPTCTTAGYRTRVCTAEDCTVPPAVQTNNLAALGHDWGAWFEDGDLEKRVCQRAGCNAFETREPWAYPEVTTPFPQSNTIICWGDSLTRGEESGYASVGVKNNYFAGALNNKSALQDYPQHLSTLVPSTFNVIGQGQSWMYSDVITAWAGTTTVIRTAADVTLPANGSAVGFTSKNFVFDETGSGLHSEAKKGNDKYKGLINPEYSLEGHAKEICGWLGSTRVRYSGALGAQTLALYEAGSAAVTIPAGTQFVPEAAIAYPDAIHVVFAGTNDGPTDENIVNGAIARIKRFVDSIPSGRYIVVSPHNRVEWSTTAMKNKFSTAFGDHWLDLYTAMSTRGLQTALDMGLIDHIGTAGWQTQGGQLMCANDQTHFNATGYKVLAKFVHEKLVELEYLDPPVDPPEPGELTQLSPANGATVALLTDYQKTWIALEPEARIKVLVQDPAAIADYSTIDARAFSYGSPVTFTWSGATGAVTLTVKKGNTTVETVTTSENTATVYNLEPGATYTWTLTSGSVTTGAFSFTTESNPPRIIKAGRMMFVRDFGGWTGLQGCKIRPNQVFRGAPPNDYESPYVSRLDEQGIDFWQNRVGLKTQIDFRNATEVSAAGANGKLSFVDNYYNYNIEYYKAYTPSEVTSGTGKNYLDTIKAILTSSKRPVYFHCAWGRDRTGTMASLILGVLGVSEDDIVDDYHLSTMRDSSGKPRTYFNDFAAFRSSIKTAYPASTFAESVEKYFLALGITKTEIETFRTEMLDGYESSSHQHVWSDWTTEVEPTCTTAGYKTRVCTAGDCTVPPAAQTNELAALGHVWGEWFVAGDVEKRLCQRAGCDAFETREIPGPGTLTDYYKVGTDPNDQKGQNSWVKSCSSTVGWSLTQGGAVIADHRVSDAGRYIVPSGAVLRSPSNQEGTTGDSYLQQPFGGAELVLRTGGNLYLQSVSNSGEGRNKDEMSGANRVIVPNLIAEGGTVLHATTGYRKRLEGAIEVRSAGLVVKQNNSGTNQERSLTIASTITGSGPIILASATYDSAAQYLRFTGDMSGFTGTFQIDSATAGHLKNEDFQITGAFGGTITALPEGFTSVEVNYAGLQGGKGLRVASTTIPTALRTKLTLFGSTTDFTAANLPLMTFPAGTTVDSSAFTVKHATAVDGTPTAFADLGTVTNGDGTITLVANATGGGDVPTEIDVPAARTGLVYTGAELVGVAAGTGYTVENGAATAAGNYTATAKLAEGYAWKNATGDQQIPWSIAKATPILSGTLAMAGWEEGKTASEPSGLSSDFGTVAYVYYSEQACSAAISKPTAVGTYWVRGEVAAAANWNAAVSAAVSFTIAEKSAWDPPTGATFYEKLANDSRKVASSDYATGGDYIYRVSDTEYIHVFKNSGTFTPKQDFANVQVLVVGGGGSGGFSNGGGGGAGGLVYRNDLSLAANAGYTVTVGAGGAATTLPKGVEASATYCTGHSGQDSVFGELTAVGGGAGGAGKSVSPDGMSGGSGGGSCGDGSLVGQCEAAQGNAGGQGCTTASGGYKTGGGGGGAGAVGGVANANGQSTFNAGHGGIGLDKGSAILGYAQFFAGGGGGGSASEYDYRRGLGGEGGGGDGAYAKDNETTYPQSGEDGLGGGGGGGGVWWNKDAVTAYNGAAGGKGIVIVRYSVATEPPAPVWDIPGETGGINALGEGDSKYVEFSSIACTASGLTVGLRAAKIDANGDAFGLVCKTDLTSDETFVVNATLAAEKDATEGVFTVTDDLGGYPQLFIVGVAPAAQ